MKYTVTHGAASNLAVVILSGMTVRRHGRAYRGGDVLLTDAADAARLVEGGLARRVKL